MISFKEICASKALFKAIFMILRPRIRCLRFRLRNLRSFPETNKIKQLELRHRV